MLCRSPLLLIAFAFAACSPPPGRVRIKLAKPQCVSLGLFAPDGKLVAQPLTAAPLAAGRHDIDCRAASPGTWKWRAVAFDPPTLEPLATIGADLAEGGNAGPPCAVSTDDRAVFLGWRSARTGHEVVACEPGGRVLWAHHHGPAESGVRSLAADGGAVFVLADADGTKLYRLNAHTGEPLAWKDRTEMEIPIASLWSDQATKIDRADWITAKNGRLYVTFGTEQFVAVLDAQTGAYVTTLTGPQPGQMSFSITPMRDPQTGERRVIDFGVAVIASHGLAYFLMEHEPPWVLMSTTRWLRDDEPIAALTLHGDTMKSDKVTIYTALGAPQHQVQLRPAEAAEGFAVAVGAPGGRAPDGPWQADALRDIRALAVDAQGQLWIAEGDEHFGRFTVWRTDGRQGVLVREIFGPLDGATLHVGEADPLTVALGGLRWRVDPATHQATCLAELTEPPAPTTPASDLRDASGLLLWQAPEADRAAWSTHRTKDGRVFAWHRGRGAEVHHLSGPEHPQPIGDGSVILSGR